MGVCSHCTGALKNTPWHAEAKTAWQEHADAIWREGALQSLGKVLHSRALVPGTELGEAFRQPLLHLMAALLGCFSFAPSSLPQPALDAVLGILTGIYQGAGIDRQRKGAPDVRHLWKDCVQV